MKTLKLKNTSKMKNSLQGSVAYSRMREERINNRSVEITNLKNTKTKMRNNKWSLRDLWNINCANIHIMGVPGEKRQKQTEKTFDNIVA